VAFTMGACFVLFTLLVLFVLLIVVVVVLPALQVISPVAAEWMLKHLIYDTSTGTISGLSKTLINFYVVVLLVRLFFLRDKVRPAIQRHGLFAIVDVVQFILYAPTGVFTLVKRVVYAVLTQAVYLGRMDVSALPRAWEGYDPAYNAYLGFLAFELYYSNPIMLSAVYQLLLCVEPESTRRSLMLLEAVKRVERDREAEDGVFLLDGPHGQTHNRRSGGTLGGANPFVLSSSEPRTDRGRRARNRWFLAYTLLKNPSLMADRRSSSILPSHASRVPQTPAASERAALLHTWVDLTESDLDNVSGRGSSSISSAARQTPSASAALGTSGNPFFRSDAGKQQQQQQPSSGSGSPWAVYSEPSLPASNADGVAGSERARAGAAVDDVDDADAADLRDFGIGMGIGMPSARQPNSTRPNPFGQGQGSGHDVQLLRQNPFDNAYSAASADELDRRGSPPPNYNEVEDFDEEEGAPSDEAGRVTHAEGDAADHGQQSEA
jgi:hypothetical protein